MDVLRFLPGPRIVDVLPFFRRHGTFLFFIVESR